MAVAARATAKAANVFESVLRSQADLVPGLDVVAQMPIWVSKRLKLHPDLVDVENKIIIEAEGFEWHGKSAQLTRDCRRYNTFTLLGWQVIRVSWAMVMFNAAYVQEILRAAVGLARSRRHQHANVSSGGMRMHQPSRARHSHVRGAHVGYTDHRRPERRAPTQRRGPSPSGRRTPPRSGHRRP